MRDRSCSTIEALQQLRQFCRPHSLQSGRPGRIVVTRVLCSEELAYQSAQDLPHCFTLHMKRSREHHQYPHHLPHHRIKATISKLKISLWSEERTANFNCHTKAHVETTRYYRICKYGKHSYRVEKKKEGTIKKVHVSRAKLSLTLVEESSRNQQQDCIIEEKQKHHIINCTLNQASNDLQKSKLINHIPLYDADLK